LFIGSRTELGQSAHSISGSVAINYIRIKPFTFLKSSEGKNTRLIPKNSEQINWSWNWLVFSQISQT